MLEHPEWSQGDIAGDLGKDQSTISCIVNTDLFKDYYAQRREEWRKRHDNVIMSKATKVAEVGLDCILEHLERRRDKVPIGEVRMITESVLDRLGYAPKQVPAVQINSTTQTNVQAVVVPVSAEALNEAREALRIAQERRAIESRETEYLPPQREVVPIDEKDEDSAPLTLSS